MKNTQQGSGTITAIVIVVLLVIIGLWVTGDKNSEERLKRGLRMLKGSLKLVSMLSRMLKESLKVLRNLRSKRMQKVLRMLLQEIRLYLEERTLIIQKEYLHKVLKHRFFSSMLHGVHHVEHSKKHP